MESRLLLERLRDAAPGAPLERLAGLAVDALAAQPLATWLSPESLAASVRQACAAWVASPASTDAIRGAVERLFEAFKDDRRTLEAATPRELAEALRAVAARPFSPDRRLVLTLIDRDATRTLVRDILLDAVLQFARKASAPVAGVAKGLGSLARFASDQVRGRAGGLGSLVGAVSDEVERQLERRAAEFVDLSLSGVFGQLADVLADPRRSGESAALRLEALQGVLELTLAQLARELANADVPGSVELVRGALATWLASPPAAGAFERVARLAFEAQGRRSLRDLLERAGLWERLEAPARAAVCAALHAVADTPAFAAWLDATLAPVEPTSA